jgi:hypothetical protein
MNIRDTVKDFVSATKFMIKKRRFMKKILLRHEEFRQISSRIQSCEDCSKAETFCENHREELEDSLDVSLQ